MRKLLFFMTILYSRLSIDLIIKTALFITIVKYGIHFVRLNAGKFPIK